jgi:hypothetical protein
MSRPPVEPLAADIDALLRQERELAPGSDEFRSRVMSRARTAWVEHQSQPRHFWARSFSQPLLRRFGTAFAVALITSASYALYQRTESEPTEPSTLHGPPRAAVPLAPSLPSAALPDAPEASLSKTNPPWSSASPAVVTKHDRVPSRVDVEADDAALELSLLQRARAAVAAGHFTAALTALGEQARRFPKSRFREEREALRIRALDGAGQRREADRATQAFRERFPRSVLLPREEKGRAAGP